jgi:hypothetical protein
VAELILNQLETPGHNLLYVCYTEDGQNLALLLSDSLSPKPSLKAGN